jgi:hypothetical protein
VLVPPQLVEDSLGEELRRQIEAFKSAFDHEGYEASERVLRAAYEDALAAIQAWHADRLDERKQRTVTWTTKHCIDKCIETAQPISDPSCVSL